MLGAGAGVGPRGAHLQVEPWPSAAVPVPSVGSRLQAPAPACKGPAAGMSLPGSPHRNCTLHLCPPAVRGRRRSAWAGLAAALAPTRPCQRPYPRQAPPSRPPPPAPRLYIEARGEVDLRQPGESSLGFAVHRPPPPDRRALERRLALLRERWGVALVCRGGNGAGCRGCRAVQATGQGCLWLAVQLAARARSRACWAVPTGLAGQQPACQLAPVFACITPCSPPCPGLQAAPADGGPCARCALRYRRGLQAGASRAGAQRHAAAGEQAGVHGWEVGANARNLDRAAVAGSVAGIARPQV